MPFVERNQSGAVCGIFTVRQSPEQEELADDHVDLLAFDLDAAKRARRALVNLELSRRNAAGFTYEDVVYQLDDLSQGRIGNCALTAGFVVQGVGDVAWPEDFAFVALDNSEVAFTAAQFIAFAAAAFTAVIDRRANARALKNAINAAADAAAVAAIDITTGWS